MKQLTATQIFARVAQLGSFSRAAQALQISQPSVTKHIASLERHYAVRLLHRNTRGVSLTEAGALFYEHCAKIEEALDMLDATMSAQRCRMQGMLRIGASVSFGHKIIAPLVIEFMEKHPDIRINLTCGNPYADMIAEGLDVAIRMGDLPDSSLGCYRVGTSPWAMIAAPSYLERNGTPDCIDHLRDHEGLIYCSQHNDDVWNYRDAFGVCRPIKIQERLRSNNLSAILDATAAGLGAAMVPLYVAVLFLKSGSVVRLLETAVLHEQQVNAVIPSPRFVSPQVRAFLEFIRVKFRENWWLSNLPDRDLAAPTSSKRKAS